MEIMCKDTQLTPDEYNTLTVEEKDDMNDLLNKVYYSKDNQCDRLAILAIRSRAIMRFKEIKDKRTNQSDIMGWL
jgi:hypothetical protein